MQRIHIPNDGCPKVTENVKIDVGLNVDDNPHSTSRQIVADNDIFNSRYSVFYKQKGKNLFKVQLHQELIEDDSVCRMQFCEICRVYVTPIHIITILK